MGWQLRPLVVWALMAGVLTVTCLPSLLGDWVFDDHLAGATNRQVSDIWGVYLQTSHDYQTDVLNPSSGVFYRPFPASISIAVKTLVSPTALAQHTLCLALYLGAIALLVGLCAGTWLRPVPATRLLLPVVLGLHPCNIELYAWMGGLNDLVSGIALAALALLLRRRLYPSHAPPHVILDVLLHSAVLLAGILSKEPFFIAALCMILAHLAADRGSDTSEPAIAQRLHRTAPALIALGLSGAVGLALRMGATGATHTRGAVDIARDASILARIPRVLAMGVETVMLPMARPVRHLSWELAQPWPLTQLVGLVLALVMVAWVLWRQHFRALILIIAAGGTLAPAAIVGDFFWPGFDRYLFVPLILLLTAALPVQAKLLPSVGGRLADVRWATFATGCLLCWLLFSDGAASNFFRNDQAFATSMITERPQDPTGYLIAIENTPPSEATAEQRAYLRSLSTRSLPPAVLHKVALLCYRVGLYPEAAASVDNAYRQAPRDPWVRFSVLELRGAQHRFDEALALARSLLADPVMCMSARAKLQGWLSSPALPAAMRPRVAALLNAHPCR